MVWTACWFFPEVLENSCTQQARSRETMLYKNFEKYKKLNRFKYKWKMLLMSVPPMISPPAMWAIPMAISPRWMKTPPETKTTQIPKADENAPTASQGTRNRGLSFWKADMGNYFSFKLERCASSLTIHKKCNCIPALRSKIVQAAKPIVEIRFTVGIARTPAFPNIVVN